MNNYYNMPNLSNMYRHAFSEPQSQYHPGNSMGSPASQMPPVYPLPPIGTALPTGLPSGSNMAPPPTLLNTPAGELAPQTVQNSMYMPGYLKTQIGKKVLVQFLIGSTGTTDRTGTLLGVGASYILIRPENTDDVLLCDLYSIKFVTFFH